MSAFANSPPRRNERRCYSADIVRPGWTTRFLCWCAWCLARSRQQQALAQLDDRLLKDIGKTRQRTIDEAAKPFWK